MTRKEERVLNQRAYRRLKNKINQSYANGRYVAIVRGKIVADVETFRELIANVDPLESDPDRRLVVQAGTDYPEKLTMM